MSLADLDRDFAVALAAHDNEFAVVLAFHDRERTHDLAVKLDRTRDLVAAFPGNGSLAHADRKSVV